MPPEPPGTRLGKWHEKWLSAICTLELPASNVTARPDLCDWDRHSLKLKGDSSVESRGSCLQISSLVRVTPFRL